MCLNTPLDVVMLGGGGGGGSVMATPHSCTLLHVCGLSTEVIATLSSTSLYIL